jgi:hypothetical protein
MRARRQLSKTNPTIQLRAKRELRDAMMQRAREEGLTLASWVRVLCVRELRRTKAA